MRIHTWSRLLSLPLILLALLVGGCKVLGINPGLPDETQNGKNTFGCRVNGDIWLSYTEHTLDRALEPEYDLGWFTLRAEREKGDIPYINLQLSDSLLLQARTYTASQGFSGSVTVSENGQNDVYVQLPGDEATITLTKAEPPSASGKDEVIVSGTFSFVATSTLTGKKITVTEGRFDVKAR